MATNAQKTIADLIHDLDYLRGSKRLSIAYLTDDAESAACVAHIFRDVVTLVDAAGAEMAAIADVEYVPLLESDAYGYLIDNCEVAERDRTPREDMREEHGTLNKAQQGV